MVRQINLARVFRVRRKGNKPVTTIFADGVYVGQFHIAHVTALDMYDPFDAIRPAYIPEVQEIDWMRFIPYGCPTNERRQCSW